MVTFWYACGIFFTLGLCDSCKTNSEITIKPLKVLLNLGTKYTPSIDEIIGFYIVPIILGFLLGWGIHSFIRYLLSKL